MSKLARNEKTKLKATYWNGLSIALGAFGALAPIYAVNAKTSFSWTLMAFFFGLLVASFLIHRLAVSVLSTLED